MIRAGDLARAEATLDRAWELDQKNPQAMAEWLLTHDSDLASRAGREIRLSDGRVTDVVDRRTARLTG